MWSHEIQDAHDIIPPPYLKPPPISDLPTQNSCAIAAAPGNTVASGAYFLGRPWTEYARVVFQYCTMTAVINSAGWEQWSTSTPNTAGVLFGEFGNTGAGASTSARASFSEVLTAAVSINTILGSSYTTAGYYDATYM